MTYVWQDEFDCDGGKLKRKATPASRRTPRRSGPPMAQWAWEERGGGRRRLGNP